MKTGCDSCDNLEYYGFHAETGEGVFICNIDNTEVNPDEHSECSTYKEADYEY